MKKVVYLRLTEFQAIKMKKTCIRLTINVILCFLCILPGKSQESDKFLFEKANSFLNIDADSVIFYADLAYQNSGDLEIDIKLKSLILIINNQTKQGNLVDAYNNNKRADSIVNRHHQSQYQAEVLMYYGIIYNHSELISEGIKYLHRASDLDNGRISSELDYYLSQAYYLSGELLKCREYSKRSLEKEIRKGDSLKAIDHLILISSTFSELEPAIKYLDSAEMLFPIRKGTYKKVAFFNNKALIQHDIGNLSLAKKYYNMAINISMKNNYQDNLVNVFNNYAYLLMDEEKFDSAYFYLDKAERYSRDLENLSMVAMVLDSKSDYYLNVSDTSTALKRYKESIEIKNIIRQKQQIEKVLLLSTAFETEKKEKEIIQQNIEINRSRIIILIVVIVTLILGIVLIIIRHVSQIRKTRIKSLENEKRLEVLNALIKGRDEERRRLSMDLHDGIMPRIGVLKMNIETNFNETISTTKTIQMVDDISKDIRSISHQLLPPKLEDKGLVIALDNFTKLTRQSNDTEIDFYHNLQERLSSELEVNLYYLAYEMINNALKYAKADRINVELLFNEESIMLNVSDNGIGFDQDIEISGNGLKNIKNRVEYIKGKLIIDSVPNQGTDIIVEVEI